MLDELEEEFFILEVEAGYVGYLRETTLLNNMIALPFALFTAALICLIITFAMVSKVTWEKKMQPTDKQQL
ncbi:hypothetical protein BOX15_Mlig001665g2 [Macrostomum lignano]|uniref:Uncharacterized protein n=1 Tax=Macrostomum lignano TaxID=282301 RepID=A0A267FBX1_9PLAT|nr:hypothetical protein BOX15_Mlig001665g1 [Macrostomum lignano]PAA84929.1 hypothetical protein BOX15_Mlig001665g2 [Macrostomum lignano]